MADEKKPLAEPLALALQRLADSARPGHAYLQQNRKVADALRRASIPPTFAQNEQFIKAVSGASRSRLNVQAAVPSLAKPPALVQSRPLLEAIRKSKTLAVSPEAAEALRKAAAPRLIQNQQLVEALRRPTAGRTISPVPRPAPHQVTSPPQWREAANQIRQRTLGLIVEMDPSLVVRLDGAWERVVRGGPHCASQAAHSVVEFVDWCLRVAAPDEDVLRWHRELKRPTGELENQRPTRGLRMRYILRDRDPDGDAARLYVKHALDLLRLLQAIKHSGDDSDRRVVAASIMSLEAALVFLFARSDPS